jgi:hypothetical protein
MMCRLVQSASVYTIVGEITKSKIGRAINSIAMPLHCQKCTCTQSNFSFLGS